MLKQSYGYGRVRVFFDHASPSSDKQRHRSRSLHPNVMSQNEKRNLLVRRRDRSLNFFGVTDALSRERVTQQLCKVLLVRIRAVVWRTNRNTSCGVGSLLAARTGPKEELRGVARIRGSMKQKHRTATALVCAP